MNSIVKKIIRIPFGKNAAQGLFEAVHRYSLLGMNIGTGGSANGNGESHVLSYIKKKFPEYYKPVIFDVGANFGQYLNLVLNEFGDEADIYSFEPSLYTYKKLSASMDSERGNVTLINEGFGKVCGEIVLYSDSKGSGMASVYKRNLDYLGVNFESTETVKINTVDQFANSNGVDKIDLLKLDVEGHELDVLMGAMDSIESGRIRYIQFEFGGCNLDSRTYFRDFFFLLNENYRIYRVLKDGLRRIREYDERLEIFKTTNFLAERR